MLKIFLRPLSLPFVMLLSGLLMPIAILLLQPSTGIDGGDLLYWPSCWIYLGLAFAATELTTRYIVAASPATGTHPAHAVQAHARSATLIIMALAFFSLGWTQSPLSLQACLFFISLRLGITLLLLGLSVLIFTHITLRKLAQ